MRGFYADFIARFVAYIARAGLVLVGLSWSVSAHAGASAAWTLVPKAIDTGTSITIGYGGSGTALGTMGRQLVTSAANDALMLSESASVSTPAGNLGLSLVRSVNGAALRGALGEAAVAIGRGGLVGVAALAAGALLQPVLEGWMVDMGYHKNSDGTWGTGAPVTAPSTSPSTQICFEGRGCAPGTNWYSAYMSLYPNSGADGASVCAAIPHWDQCYVVKAGGTVIDTVYANSFTAGQGSFCPDGSKDAVSCVGPTSTVDTPPVSSVDVAAKAATAPFPPVTPEQWMPVIDAAADLGVAVPSPSESISVVGPSSVQSDPVVVSTTTTTDANGNSVTTVTTQTTTTNLNYSNTANTATVNYTSTVTTTTTNPATNQTQTTTTPLPQPNPNPNPNPNPSPTPSADVCSLLPGVLGCTQLGSPEAASMPTASKSIAFTAESVSLPSGCPAPISVGRFGSISFQSACDSAGYMRPLILAGSAITALMICVVAVAGVKP